MRVALEKPQEKGGSGLTTLPSDLGIRGVPDLEKVSLSNKEVTAPLYKNNTDKNGFFAVAKNRNRRKR